MWAARPAVENHNLHLQRISKHVYHTLVISYETNPRKENE